MRRIATSLRRTCGRTIDLVGRYGGEEFVVFLPNTCAAGAGHVAEAIRCDVEALGIVHGRSIVATMVTVSVGGVHISGVSGLGMEALFREADAALYRAKVRRNAVVMSEPASLSAMEA